MAMLAPTACPWIAAPRKPRLRLVVCAAVLTACAGDGSAGPQPEAPTPATRYVRFLASLVRPSGLVISSPADAATGFTTGWKNALAAMVFLHEGNAAAARGILDPFQAYQQQQGSAFRGLPKEWNALTGRPAPQAGQGDPDYYWVGDGATVLLAARYYGLATGDSARYASLVQALKGWLRSRVPDCRSIVAEGAADMYAALVPYRSEPGLAAQLDSLQQCIAGDLNLSAVLDHTVRAALVLGDPSGFQHVAPFQRVESWCIDPGTRVRAYAAFTSESYVNVEISAQLLLAWKLWGQDSGIDLSFLESELRKLDVGTVADTTARALPYLVAHHQWGTDQNPTDCGAGIVDPTAFLLFALWDWNPFSLSARRSAR